MLAMSDISRAEVDLRQKSASFISEFNDQLALF